ncbi:MAG: hypothetical protein ACXWK3_05730 [Reyranella sp.]
MAGEHPKVRFTALSIGYSLPRRSGSLVAPILVKDRMNARLA